jgi:predicted dehydrogenase
MPPSPLKIALFGAGHLGKIHLQQWAEVEGATVIGVYDTDATMAAEAAAKYNVPRWEDAEALIQAADAVDIVTATMAHYEVAVRCIAAGRHVFVEKPLAHSLAEAEALVTAVKEKGVVCAVGHVERYNPALLALEEAPSPMFIETHRLAQFTPRGADVSVILDLMIHDLDIILHLVKSPVKHLSASGVAVISETYDIANARIEFENGCVANLTSSRISLKRMRKMRFFQRDAYIGVDFLEKKTEVVRLKDGDKGEGPMDLPLELPDGQKKIISVTMPEAPPGNAIRAELADFAAAIATGRPPRVTAADGYAAMELAHRILQKMDEHRAMHNL